MKSLAFKLTIVVVIICIGSIAKCQAQLLSNDDNPSLIDRILQVVWEPSSLIRMWVGLDQLYNIVLSWRGVARTLASLPFGDDGTMAHVRIQQPRRAEGRLNLHQRQSGTTHNERFNLIYTGNKDSAADAELKRYLSMRNQGQLVLPPPFLFHPQEVFINNDISNLLSNIQPEGPFENRDDVSHRGKSTHPTNMLTLPSTGVISQKYATFGSGQKLNHLYPHPSLAPLGLETNEVLEPQKRLNMFLNLLRNLKESHMKDLDNTDSPSSTRNF